MLNVLKARNLRLSSSDDRISKAGVHVIERIRTAQQRAAAPKPRKHSFLSLLAARASVVGQRSRQKALRSLQLLGAWVELARRHAPVVASSAKQELSQRSLQVRVLVDGLARGIGNRIEIAMLGQPTRATTPPELEQWLKERVRTLQLEYRQKQSDRALDVEMAG